MIYIDAKKVIETRIAESMGFEKYKHILEIVQKTDVSTDLDFQRSLMGFAGCVETRNGGKHIMICLRG